MRPNRGFTFVHLLLALAVATLIAVITAPALLTSFGELRLEMAAREAARILHLARSHAVHHNTRTGVRFYPGRKGEPTTWTLYVDGDGDGVRNRDVRRGTDPPVPAPDGGVRRPLHLPGTVTFGFPAGPLPRDPSGRRLRQRHDPVRFGRSDIAGFGPLGTATPGTLYLTDGRRLTAVGVTSRTGRVRVVSYHRDSGEWR